MEVTAHSAPEPQRVVPIILDIACVIPASTAGNRGECMPTGFVQRSVGRPLRLETAPRRLPGIFEWRDGVHVYDSGARFILSQREVRMFRTRRSLPSLFGITLFFAGAVGCGNDGSTAAPSCSGAGCTCVESACTCEAGGDCVTDCGDSDCSVECTTAAKCNNQTNGALTLVCQDTSQCKGNGGDGSSILCEQTSNCDLKSGSDSTATCRDDATCKINIGPNSTIACEDTALCDLSCDPPCVVTCAATADCSLSCGTDDAGVAAVDCGDGRLVCGQSC